MQLELLRLPVPLCNLFDLNDTDFRLDFENRCRGIPGDATGPLSGKNLSEVVNNIVWVRQLELKVIVLIQLSSEHSKTH